MIDLFVAAQIFILYCLITYLFFRLWGLEQQLQNLRSKIVMDKARRDEEIKQLHKHINNIRNGRDDGRRETVDG